jgi:hypothetical protein
MKFYQGKQGKARWEQGHSYSAREKLELAVSGGLYPGSTYKVEHVKFTVKSIELNCASLTEIYQAGTQSTYWVSREVFKTEPADEPEWYLQDVILVPVENPRLKHSVRNMADITMNYCPVIKMECYPKRADVEKEVSKIIQQVNGYKPYRPVTKFYMRYYYQEDIEQVIEGCLKQQPVEFGEKITTRLDKNGIREYILEVRY